MALLHIHQLMVSGKRVSFTQKPEIVIDLKDSLKAKKRDINCCPNLTIILFIAANSILCFSPYKF